MDIWGKFKNLKSEEMKNTVFIEDRWVKFTFNDVMCIGITYFQFDADNDVPFADMVYLISKDRETKVIRFDECSNLRYLQFIKKPGNVKALLINKDAISLAPQFLQRCPGISQKNRLIFAQNQLNHLNYN